VTAGYIRPTVLVTLAAIIGAASALFAGSASAAEAGTIALRPAHVDANDRATNAYFKRGLAPGSSFSDQVIVSNPSSVSIDLIVSPVDGLTGPTTGSVYANRQDPLHKAGEWVTPATGQLKLDAHAETLVPFTVRVPSSAQPGDHLAGIAFENAHPQNAGGQFSITQVVRGVIGVLVQVTGPAQPFRLHISGIRIQSLPAASQQAALVVHLANEGQILGKPNLLVSLAGPSGYQHTTERQLDTVLPGDSLNYDLPWPDALASGSYHACAWQAVNGIQEGRYCTDVNVGQSYSGPSRPSRSTSSPSSLPLWLLLMAIVGGSLGGGVVVALVQRRAQRRQLRRR
jgi:hypothetical protein